MVISYYNTVLNNVQKRKLHIGLLLLCYSLFFIIASCSTEKNTMVHRTYHNTTAKFNGYFNAKEIIKEALTSFRSSYEEDYSAILPIYIYANKDNASTFYSPMDTAIKKSSVVIAKHSMPNPKFTKKQKR